MSDRSQYVRVDDKTKRAIKILVARKQLKSASSVSERVALWDFIEKHDPQLAKQALEHAENNDDRKS